jgi:GTPase SAR1 family protein
MSHVVVVSILAILVAGLGAAVVALASRWAATNRALKAALTHGEGLQRSLDAAQGQLAGARQQLVLAQSSSTALTTQLEQAQAGDKQKEGWLDHQQQEIDWLRAELEKRPTVTRKTYKILTLGMKATGKTSLTLKWANPLIDLGAVQGTKIERYERTVSQVALKDVTTEHVFEIGDWGGEHIVDAQQELIVDEIHGLLIVVDLGGKDAKVVQPERIQEQLREFQPQSLKYFFGPKTVASCKTVVLFINKADLVPGTPADAEAQAKKLYARLIDDLMAHHAQVDIRVLVGSASYGHSTHHLFSHFVEKILPKNAYDNQLLQRMKSDLAGAVARPLARIPKVA